MSCENQIHGAATRTESTQTLGEQVTFQVCIETIEQDAVQNLSSDGEQGDVAVVVTEVPVPFGLEEVDNGSVFKIQWQPVLCS